MFEELKQALAERAVAFEVVEGAWCPTLRVEIPSGGYTAVEIYDFGGGMKMAVSNDGAFPTTFTSVRIVAGTLAMIARC